MTNVSKKDREHSVGRCGKAFAFVVVAAMIACAFCVVPVDSEVADATNAPVTNDQAIYIGGDTKAFETGGVSWDGNGKIVMNNVNMVVDATSGSYSAIRIQYTTSVELELIGSNSITISVKDGCSACYGIYCYYSMYISGDGSLDINIINGQDNPSDDLTIRGMYSYYSLFVDGSKITSTTDDFTAVNSIDNTAIFAYDWCAITNNATIRAQSGDANCTKSTDSKSYALNSIYGLEIDDSTADLKAGAANKSYGLCSLSGEINLYKSDVKAIGETKGIYADDGINATGYDVLYGTNDLTKDPVRIDPKDIGNYKYVWTKVVKSELASGTFVLLGIAFVILLIVAGLYVRKDHH